MGQISIKIMQVCGELLTLPLKIIFEATVNDGVFPDDWKKGNTVLFDKKDFKNMLKNYRPTILFPIFAKMFEKINIHVKVSVFY